MKKYRHNSKNKRYLYHVTQGKISNLNWEPRDYGVNRSDLEPDIARICCSTSIQGCLIALCSCLENDEDIVILRSVKKVNYYIPTKKEVVDSKITNEVWRLKKTSFKVLKIIKPHILPQKLFDISVGTLASIHKQSLLLRELNKLKQLKQLDNIIK